MGVSACLLSGLGKVLTGQGCRYYSSGADDEITMRENHLAYHRVFFRPRILRNVEKVDYSTTILGQKSSMPVCESSQ